MTEERARSPFRLHSAERLGTFAQILAIALGAGWGVYTFLLKDVIWPQAAQNIGLNLDVDMAGTRAQPAAGGGRLAIEMRVAAHNQPPRGVAAAERLPRARPEDLVETWTTRRSWNRRIAPSRRQPTTRRP